MTKAEAAVVKGLIKVLPGYDNGETFVKHMSERQVYEFCVAVDAMVDEDGRQAEETED